MSMEEIETASVVIAGATHDEALALKSAIMTHFEAAIDTGSDRHRSLDDDHTVGDLNGDKEMHIIHFIKQMGRNPDCIADHFDDVRIGELILKPGFPSMQLTALFSDMADKCVKIGIPVSLSPTITKHGGVHKVIYTPAFFNLTNPV